MFLFFQVCEASWVPERGPEASVQRGKDQGRRKCEQGEMWEEMTFLVEILQHDPSPHNYNTNANPRSSPTCPQYKARIRTSRLPNSFNRFHSFSILSTSLLFDFHGARNDGIMRKIHTKKKLKKALKTRENALYLLGGLQKQAKVP